jgi:bifunctional non-homologous end joining protein LigD
MLTDLIRRLRPLETGTSPFTRPVLAEQARDAHWTQPRLVGEVTFTEWTSDGSMRHPSWRGLPPDKSPAMPWSSAAS